MSIEAFKPTDPLPGDISVTSTPSTVALGAGNDIRMVNLGNSIVRVALGSSSVTAADTDIPIPPGVVEVWKRRQGQTYIAVKCASGQTSVLNVSCGEGL